MTKDVTLNLDERDEPITPPKIPVGNRMVEILEQINDPHRSAGEINRLISGELASAVSEMGELTQTNGYRLKFLSERIKALRELSKTLVESELLSKKDILNFDGPKFQYVFQEITASFKKAMKDAGLQDAAANEVLRNFRDIMAMKENDLRKQTEKVEAGTFIDKKG